jgi:pentose-5-phosphate-3-epimerase
MNKIIISPSILDYESDLKKNFGKIHGLLDAGIEYLHIDIMRRPFIEDRDAFSEDSINILYGEFKHKAKFDFHLMVSSPIDLFRFIDPIIEKKDKKETLITIHSEAYRVGLGEYNKKEYDLLRLNGKEEDLQSRIGLIVRFSKLFSEATLDEIKQKGYLAGIALEPNTSLENLQGLENLFDLILFMSVHSGKGGQEFIPNTLNKINEAKELYPGKIIQVDGGVNEKTISDVTKSGASNLVIGSYITRAENIEQRINEINRFL